MCIRDSNNRYELHTLNITCIYFLFFSLQQAGYDHSCLHFHDTEMSFHAVSYTHLDVYKRQLHYRTQFEKNNKVD